MFVKANPVRDPFAFSLGGMAAISSYVSPLAIADNGINKAIDQRLSRPDADGAPKGRRTILIIEDLLARYFAPQIRTAL